MYGKIYPITYSEVFKHINQLEVWQDILGYVRVGQLVSNPFRFDSNPGCYLREAQGVLLFTDFAYPEFSTYTCVHAVAKLKDVELSTAASIIMAKYKYNAPINFTTNCVSSNVIKKETSTSNIHFDPYTDENGKACFIQQDKDYWSKRFITSSQLNKHNVYSVKCLYLNESQIFSVKPTYAYYFPENGRMKVYSPFDTKHKWVSNTTKDDIWCSNIFPLFDVAIITKSLKDLMVLENVVDVEIYAFQNEGMIPNTINWLNNYKHVYILYDNDAPGIYASKKLKEQLSNSSSIQFDPTTNCKDADDYVIKYGKAELHKYIYNLL